MPLRGDIRSVQVPGAVDGWLALHERYGRLPLDEVLAPAIELAEDGFAASVMLALASHLVHALPGAGELCPDGPLEIGQTRACARASPARCAPSPATGATASTPASSAAACWRSETATSPRQTWPTSAARVAPRRCALAAWGHDLWTVPPPSQGYLTLAGAWRRRGGGARDRSRRPALGPSPRRVVARRRARPPGHALRRRRRGRAPRPRPPGRRRRPRRPGAGAPPPDVAPGHGTTGPAVTRLADGDTTHLCAAGCGRPRHLADAVQRAATSART